MPWEKQFDRTDALQRAQRVLWRRGYEHCSLNTLLKGMGIQKGSFYATFGSKHSVLVEALQLYIQQRFDSFQKTTDGRPPLEALRRHLDQVVEESTGADRSLGCFLVNCATELAPKDPVIREIVAATFQAHTAFYRSLIDKARQGAATQIDTDSAATALLGLVLGMRVLARGGAPTPMIRGLRRQADALLGL
jgi:TetR/AcrR family transcriptional regulator, transcriptional repressor for nem operon